MIDRERLLNAVASTRLGAALMSRFPLVWPRSSRAYEGDLVCSDSRRPYAIVSTVTDNFIGAGAVFLMSLHEKLDNRSDVDVILVQSTDIAPLSPENRSILSGLCPGLRFVDVEADFLNAENMTRYDKRGRPVSVALDAEVLPSKRAAYLKLNVLRFTQYDKVVLMDSDLMIVRDFSELFKIKTDIAAVRGGRRDPRALRERVPRRLIGRGFNSGVLLLNRQCRGEGPFNAAIDFLDKKRNKRLRDQSVLNHLFKRVGKTFLPDAYNYKLSKADPDMLDDAEALESAKIIHFVGTSKWELKNERNRGKPLYDRFHEIQARTGAPFILEG